MNYARGILKTWIKEKGYGFIRPEDGGKDVFVHIRDIGDIGREPRQGDVVKYQVMSDGRGRLRAGDVHVKGLPRRPAAVEGRDGQAVGEASRAGWVGRCLQWCWWLGWASTWAQRTSF